MFDGLVKIVVDFKRGCSDNGCLRIVKGLALIELVTEVGATLLIGLRGGTAKLPEVNGFGLLNAIELLSGPALDVTVAVVVFETAIAIDLLAAPNGMLWTVSCWISLVLQSVDENSVILDWKMLPLSWVLGWLDSLLPYCKRYDVVERLLQVTADDAVDVLADVIAVLFAALAVDLYLFWHLAVDVTVVAVVDAVGVGRLYFVPPKHEVEVIAVVTASLTYIIVVDVLYPGRDELAMQESLRRDKTRKVCLAPYCSASTRSRNRRKRSPSALATALRTSCCLRKRKRCSLVANS
uniref:Uncharacterized protein n=1 Tax=Glossina austeni TaxID=7395 RepID=A0A1A9V226_GLOAU